MKIKINGKVLQSDKVEITIEDGTKLTINNEGINVRSEYVEEDIPFDVLLDF